MDQITIRRPDDFHVHLRQGPMMHNVIEFTARDFARALVMPNIESQSGGHINTIDDMRDYLTMIALHLNGRFDFEPLTTISVSEAIGPDEIRLAKKHGAIAGKLYPVGSTTGAEHGCQDPRSKAMLAIYEAMQECGLVLSIHGEEPEAPALEREVAFLPVLEFLVQQFPRLKIVLEHVSSRYSVGYVKALPATVAATITPHHLILTLDDLLGGQLNPHHFCKPVVKTTDDCAALMIAATGGNPKFFFGSDSAPHGITAKERFGAAGIFNAPVALPLLAKVFREAGALKYLNDFVSRFGAEFYGLPLNEGIIELKRESWKVPDNYEGIIPMLAGRELAWQVVRD